MNKKDITLWLFPIVFFLIITCAALFAARMEQKIQKGDSAKFEEFVSNVQSGKWQLTTDKWIEGMRQQQALLSTYESLQTSMQKFLYVLTISSLLGLIFQVAAALHFRKRLKTV